MNTTENIKNRLKKLDTASVSDAMDSLGIFGGLQSIKSVVGNQKIAGPVFTVQYEEYTLNTQSFQNAGNYIDDVPEGGVIVVDNQGRIDCTSWGNILTTKAIQKHISGTIIYGSVRDISEIRKLNYPLFAKNIYMVSGKNRARIKALQCELCIDGVKIKPNDWVLCDDNGALVIPHERLLEVVVRAENVETTEMKIIETIKNGHSLEEAREMFSYATPWSKNND